MQLTNWKTILPVVVAIATLVPGQRTEVQAQEIPQSDLEEYYYPRETPYDRYMRLGYAAMQRENYDNAAAYFRAALYQHPQDRQAMIAYWNARDAINEQGQDRDQNQPKSNYDRYMQMGYDATEEGDYQTALINFKKALTERPGDYYATQAIRNVDTYIDAGEGISEN